MIKAILFDIDDTLIKTFETKKEALKELGRKYYSTDLNDEQIKKVWGTPIRDLLRSLFPTLLDIEEAFERYVDVRKRYPTVAYDGVLPALNNLRKKYILGLVSSKSRRYLKDDLDIANISKELFFVIQTEEDTHIHKPDPKVFDLIIGKLLEKRIRKSEILYIGDRLTDYFAARDAGIHFYGIVNRTTDKEEFETEGANTIKNLQELIGIIT